jgi:hypothetical protein
MRTMGTLRRGERAALIALHHSDAPVRGADLAEGMRPHGSDTTAIGAHRSAESLIRLGLVTGDSGAGYVTAPAGAVRAAEIEEEGRQDATQENL